MAKVARNEVELESWVLQLTSFWDDLKDTVSYTEPEKSNK